MAKAIQNQFDGGIATDTRTHSINQCADSTNFNVFDNPYKLVHLRDMVAETDGGQTINNTKISNVGQTVIGGTEFMVANYKRWSTFINEFNNVICQ